MNFFYIQGLNQHDLMPFGAVFGKGKVKKIDRTKPTRAVDPRLLNEVSQNHQGVISVSDVYQRIEKLKPDQPVLFAHQIMQKPVVTSSPAMNIEQAFKLFKTRAFRHLPVVLANGKVTGIISDRDILQYRAGLDVRDRKKSIRVKQLMKSPVITSVLQTDVRYIARLFIEQHIGAIPIVEDGAIAGIITRSDILHAMIKHYELELWA